jgi:primary-amine oxidase
MPLACLHKACMLTSVRIDQRSLKILTHIVEIRGFNESDWTITEWYYNGILYNGSEAIHDAWKQGRVVKSLPNVNGDWTDPEPRERAVVDRDMAAPVLVQPYGPRVTVDEEEKYVKWLDWEFYLSFSQVKALALFDVRFRGERIMYEVGLEEAMAHYAGNSPESASRLFFDTVYGFGLLTFSLIPGFDCPAYATYLPVMFYSRGKLVKRENVICVFEAVSDHPLQRHTTDRKVTASRNSYLVVRTVSTIGNYDYTIRYVLTHALRLSH